MILSWALTGQRKYREAIPVLQEAVAIIEREQGDVRSKLPSIYTQLGVSYLGILDPPVAEQAFRKAVASALALFDAEHESVLQTRMRLGRFLCETDRPDEGFRLIREALDQAVRTKGADDSFHTAGVMLTYGRWLVTYGRVEDGLKLLERSNDIRIRGKRTATDAYREAREYQAVAETVLGDYRQAAEHLREAGSGPGATSARVRLFLATADTDRARKALAEFGAPSPTPRSSRWSEYCSRPKSSSLRGNSRTLCGWRTTFDSELRTAPSRLIASGSPPAPLSTKAVRCFR